MLIDIVSLVIGAIIGFIISIALIKENSNNIVQEYREKNIELEYEIRLLNMSNRQLKDTLELLDEDTLELYRKSDYITILHKKNYPEKKMKQ